VGNNNKMTKNDVRMVWVFKRFVDRYIFELYRCETTKKMTEITCKRFGWKRRHLGFVFISDRFLCRRYWALVTSIF